MNQSQQRKEVYSWVIEATIENAKAEFEKEGMDAKAIAALADLKYRWQTRLEGSEVDLENADAQAAQGGDDDGPPQPLEPSMGAVNQYAAASGDRNGSDIPQNDGADGDDDEADEGDEPEAKRAKVDNDGGDDEGEDDQDPEDVDDDTVGPEPEAYNFILAQHDKVSRRKNQWKVGLKDCVVHLEGRDLLFKTLACDLQW